MSLIVKAKGRRYRVYDVEGEPTIGVHHNEPFEIEIENVQHRRLGLRVTLDGTDILTGKPANLEPSGGLWIVEAHQPSLTLSAWPESREGGASFVFTAPEAGVALHTHGDTSHVGVIAVATFVDDAPRSSLRSAGLGSFERESPFMGGGRTRGGDFGYEERGGGENLMRGGPAVGAGSFAAQRIATTTGLRQPRLASTEHVRHMWWDELQAKIREAAPRPSLRTWVGFPAASEVRGLDLSAVPRVETGDPRFV